MFGFKTWVVDTETTNLPIFPLDPPVGNKALRCGNSDDFTPALRRQLAFSSLDTTEEKEAQLMSADATLAAQVKRCKSEDICRRALNSILSLLSDKRSGGWKKPQHHPTPPFSHYPRAHLYDVYTHTHAHAHAHAQRTLNTHTHTHTQNETYSTENERKAIHRTKQMSTLFLPRDLTLNWTLHGSQVQNSKT